MLSSICLIRHSFIFLQIYDYFVKPTRITVFFHENVFFEVFARMLLISLFSFCCLIFRLGGTGLGLTEEVEDVGDLHRGELLAVLAIPFASIFLAISRLRWDMPSSMPSALLFSIPSSIPFWYLSSRRYRSFMASKPRTAIVSIPTSENAKTIAVLTS